MEISNGVKRGFTIIEVLVAIFLITMGIGGAFIVVNQTISSASISFSRFQASYLAQEGVETVRNQRDSNWLKKQYENPDIAWDDGIVSSIMTVQSKFERGINITLEGPDILKVVVLVKWQERGRSHQVRVQENLYKWQ